MWLGLEVDDRGGVKATDEKAEGAEVRVSQSSPLQRQRRFSHRREDDDTAKYLDERGLESMDEPSE